MPKQPAWPVRLAAESLNAVFPHSCAFCGQVCHKIPEFMSICRNCLALLPLRPRQLARLDWHEFGENDAPPESAAYSAAWYSDPLRKALIRLKFSDAPEVAEALAAILVQCCRQNGLDCCAVAAVPLHPTRLRERGYNQAGLLAANLARQLDRPDWSAGLIRVRSTGRQSDLKDRLARRVNMNGAFSLDLAFVRSAMQTCSLIAAQPVLLIDDILTTGATLTEAARPFWQLGIPVTGLVVASDHTTGKQG